MPKRRGGKWVDNMSRDMFVMGKTGRFKRVQISVPLRPPGSAVAETHQHDQDPAVGVALAETTQEPKDTAPTPLLAGNEVKNANVPSDPAPPAGNRLESWFHELHPGGTPW